MVGMIYWDMKFGRAYAEWDAEPHSQEEIEHVLKTFCLVSKHTPFHVAVIWFDARQFAIVEKALEAAAYNNIQSVYWYKAEQNQTCPVHLRVPAVEVGIIAFHGQVTNFSAFINLPTDLFDRHNILVGPGQRTYVKTATDVTVNVCQKPAHLSEYFGKHYCQPHSNLVVLGSGAGGDVQGLMNSGLKIHAIEQDEKQSQAMMANLRGYVVKDELWKLVPNEKFRVVRAAPPVAEVVEAPPIEVKCGKCEKDTQMPPSEKCHSCGAICCQECIPRTGVTNCLVCEEVFRSVDVSLPKEPAAEATA